MVVSHVWPNAFYSFRVFAKTRWRRVGQRNSFVLLVKRDFVGRARVCARTAAERKNTTRRPAWCCWRKSFIRAIIRYLTIIVSYIIHTRAHTVLNNTRRVVYCAYQPSTAFRGFSRLTKIKKKKKPCSAYEIPVELSGRPPRLDDCFARLFFSEPFNLRR